MIMMIGNRTGETATIININNAQCNLRGIEMIISIWRKKNQKITLNRRGLLEEDKTGDVEMIEMREKEAMVEQDRMIKENIKLISIIMRDMEKITIEIIMAIRIIDEMKTMDRRITGTIMNIIDKEMIEEAIKIKNKEIIKKVNSWMIKTNFNLLNPQLKKVRQVSLKLNFLFKHKSQKLMKFKIK